MAFIKYLIGLAIVGGLAVLLASWGDDGRDCVRKEWDPVHERLRCISIEEYMRRN